MVNESEVCCGIVNWLIKKQEQYNRESLKKQIGFFVGVESAKKIGEWIYVCDSCTKVFIKDFFKQITKVRK